MSKVAKRTLACMVLIIYIFGAFPFITSAAEVTITTSDAALEFIKGYEGFSAKIHSIGSNYYIGNGTICKPGDYPNGVTQEEAHGLLRKTVQRMETSLNNFLAKYGIVLNQNQYDAIISFTYNLGTGWLGYTNRLRTALIEGPENYTGVQFADAMAIWCHTGKSVNKQLLSRRISEARMFLYGDYGTGDSPNFNYLILNPGTGEIQADVVLFESGKPYGVLPSAELTDYALLGWHTQDGQIIEATAIVEKSYNVNAVWTDEIPPTKPVEPTEPIEKYSDISSADWFYPYVSSLINDNIISGYPDGTFKPYKPATYGETLKLILLAAGYEAKEPTNSHWASGYADFAVSEGFIETDITLNLDDPITRLTVATIASKALSLPESTLETPFTDTDNTHVLSLYETGIIEGSTKDDTLVFLPDNSIKRSEISAIILRINQSLELKLILIKMLT